MRCPKCHSQDGKVIDSRAVKDGDGVRRRRECLNCQFRFTTYEEIINADLKVVKSNAVREDFDREKLRRGIEKACWKRPIPREEIDRTVLTLANEIERDFEREVTTDEIGKRVMNALCELDEVAYIRFASVYRRFKDSTEFIAEIKTMNDQKPPK